MIPDTEELSVSNEIINEVFSNYRATLQRLEVLKEDNIELNRKANQDRLFQDIKNLDCK